MWQARRMPEPTPAALTAALVAELARKTATCWVRTDGRAQAVWHVWYDGALCLVSGGQEQPMPEIADGGRVEVTLRSKDNGGRLVTWVGTASVVRPGSEAWDGVSTALVAGRLNAPDLATAADGWAVHSVVRRVVPTGETLESPGQLSDQDHRETPRETPATTRGPLPRILHRRVERRPKLS